MIDAPEVCRHPVAVGCTKDLRRIREGPTADHADRGVSVLQPSGSICWRTFVILVPDILNPLPDIASHVIKAKCIWLEGPNWRRLFIIPLASAAVAIGVVLPDVFTPIKGGRGAGACGVLPFGLCE